MRFKRRSASSGAVDFPILPVIVVIVVILVVVVISGRIHNTSFVVGGFQVQADDIAATDVKSLPDQQIDFVMHLTQPGADRLSTWAASHPNTELPLTFSGTYLGKIMLTPGMDTTTIHLTATPAAAAAVRYSLGR